MLEKKLKTRRQRRAKVTRLKSGAERRRYPRIEAKLPLSVAANGYGFSTLTQNVSCLGAYCCINKYIPPFTKVGIKMVLPVSIPPKHDNINVECQGVVVRTDDAREGGFNIAIFFNRIQDIQRRKISQYLKQFLPQGAPSPKRK